jgi:hypothetical protein
VEDDGGRGRKKRRIEGERRRENQKKLICLSLGYQRYSHSIVMTIFTSASPELAPSLQIHTCA